MTNAWDAAKAVSNLEKHGVAFEAADAFEWETALFALDARAEYGETRYAAFSFIGERLYVVVFTIRNGRAWIISLRKANRKEAKHYGKFIEA